MAEGVRIGEVIHFYNKIQVAVLRISEPIKLGDRLAGALSPAAAPA